MANISAIKLPSGNTYDLVDKTSGYVTTDNKLEISSVSNGSYYPIVASNSTTAAIRQYDNTGFEYYVSNGTTSTRGYSKLTLGNSISVNNVGNKEGIIRLYGQYNGYVDISLYTYTTSGRTITIPDASGTLALTSNIKDATLTIQKNGVNVETFSANASSNKTANIVVNEVPSGGTSGQVLTKHSATDYDVSWADASGGGAYIVTFTYDNQNETWSCDKTAQEIYEANEAGYTVIAFAINSYYDGYVFYLDTATTLPLEGGGTQVYTHFRTLARFSKYGSSVYYFELFEIEYADNNITFSECMFDTNGFIKNYETENVTSGLYISSESGAFAEHYNLSSGKSADIYWSSREGEQNDETLIKFTADHIKADNFTPTENDDVSTKKYVDDAVSGVSVPTKTSDLTNDSGFITGMTILSYGHSTWADFLEAYNANKIVYCRASSNANPASGSQTRLAFMAYVNNATTPTEVEFQYYRSVSTHTASQQGDQVYVYKLNKTNGWSVTVREASVKVVAGTGLSGTYSNGTMTLTAPHDTTKQDTLVSGTNIKTINSQSLLGSGDLTIGGSNDIFIATYGTTTSAEIEQAYQAGKAIFVYYGGKMMQFAYRSSSTKHYFMSWRYEADNYYTITCDNDSWNNRVSPAVTFSDIPTTISSLVDDVGIASRDDIYPVGSYYETDNFIFNPNSSFGGNWVNVYLSDLHPYDGFKPHIKWHKIDADIPVCAISWEYPALATNVIQFFPMASSMQAMITWGDWVSDFDGFGQVMIDGNDYVLYSTPDVTHLGKDIVYSGEYHISLDPNFDQPVGAHDYIDSYNGQGRIYYAIDPNNI